MKKNLISANFKESSRKNSVIYSSYPPVGPPPPIRQYLHTEHGAGVSSGLAWEPKHFQ